MRVELTKYRVKEGKSKLVDEWIEYMHNHMDDVLMNLEGEKMFVETIFREVNDVEYYTGTVFRMTISQKRIYLELTLMKNIWITGRSVLIKHSDLKI